MIEILLQFLIRLLQRWQNRESLKTLGAARSPQWRKVRAEYLKLHPACAVCGETKKNVEVHHVRPFNLFPKLECSPENLETLCESGRNGITCHLAIGHLGSYQSWNENVREDAEVWRKKLSARP
mgnify:CR=1 FL=1